MLSASRRARDDLSREFREVVQADRNASSRPLWARKEVNENNAKVSAQGPARLRRIAFTSAGESNTGRIKTDGPWTGDQVNLDCSSTVKLLDSK
jgi:hypothetical protein